MDQEVRRALANEIAAIAVLMRERQFALCLYGGDMTEEELKDFQDTFIRGATSTYKSFNRAPDNQPISGNKE